MRLHAGLEVSERVCRRNVGHRSLIVEAFLGGMEAGLEVEDRLSVLDGHDSTGRETLAVSDPVDVVEDG